MKNTCLQSKLVGGSVSGRLVSSGYILGSQLNMLAKTIFT